MLYVSNFVDKFSETHMYIVHNRNIINVDDKGNANPSIVKLLKKYKPDFFEHIN